MSEFRFDPDRDFLLALCSAPGIGGTTLIRVLEHCELIRLKPDLFFQFPAVELCNQFGISMKAAKALERNALALQGQIEGYWRRVEQKPVALLTANSPLYPERIRAFMSSPPGFVFAYGNLEVLRQRTFCIACSRDVEPKVLEVVEQAVEEGVLRGEVLVTGANTDAYRRGAVVPLRWGSPRVLVLDRGLFRALGDSLTDEPFSVARLWRYNFDPTVDLVVSAVLPDVEFLPGANRQRDELVFALSDRVDVVHLSKSGNSAKLVERMREGEREVVER